VDPVRAIEKNGEEFLVALGRAAGAEQRDDRMVRWVIGDIPIDYHNCVVRAGFYTPRNSTLFAPEGALVGSKNIRTSEAAPVKSRRSPARATNAGRATTPVPAASCRPRSSSILTSC
jgi:hypothetical protein